MYYKYDLVRTSLARLQSIVKSRTPVTAIAVTPAAVHSTL
jgi:hypothetical protein